MTGRLSRYLAFYAHALRLGVRHVALHGASLGRRKTLGKLFQPINAVTRYPEYDAFLSILDSEARPGPGTRLLDVGGPKPFPLYLADRRGVTAVLTDIHAANYADYEAMRASAGARLHERVSFAEMDARAIPYADASFDLVLSMSVIEHIEGEAGDALALGEMWRVLKPGGLLVVSVPYGSRFVSQRRDDFSYFEDAQGPGTTHFFQRIYDAASLERMIPAGLAPHLAARRFVLRTRPRLTRAYARLGLDARALLGFASPLLAAALTRTAVAFEAAVERYGDRSRADDIYADAVLAWRKPS